MESKDCGRLEWWRWIRAHAPPSPTLRLVLVMLSTWAGSDGGSLFPSQLEVAQATGLHVKTVQRRVTQARRLGLLRAWRVNIPGKRYHRLNYHLSLPVGDSMNHYCQTTGSLQRGPKGRFKASTPPHGSIDTAAQCVSTPPYNGKTSPLREPETLPIKISLQGEDSHSQELDFRLKRMAVRLADSGRTPAEICAVMFRYEVSEAQVVQWIQEGKSAAEELM
jgi:Helix-turn-helix domain